MICPSQTYFWRIVRGYIQRDLVYRLIFRKSPQIISLKSYSQLTRKKLRTRYNGLYDPGKFHGIRKQY